MRSPDDIFQDLESDRDQREAELRLLENIAARTRSELERNMLHRSLVLLIYAHLEGFCKFALLAYIGAINSVRLRCREASSPVVAASLGSVFAALRDMNSKHPEFSRALPDDRELHMLWRERTFVDVYDNMISQRVEIPDRIVDTKSNLNTVVLKRNLYQLGLDYPEVEKHRHSIEMLLGVRNAIAHGDVLKVPKPEEIKGWSFAAFELMRFIQSVVFTALRSEIYRRRSTEEAEAGAPQI
jgi:hypothetical protein